MIRLVLNPDGSYIGMKCDGLGNPLLVVTLNSTNEAAAHAEAERWFKIDRKYIELPSETAARLALRAKHIEEWEYLQ